MALFDDLKRTYPADTIRIMEYVENDDFSYITSTYCFVDHIIKELLTPKRTYVFDPEYGSNLYKYIYDQLDESSVAGIVSEVNSIVNQYSDIVKFNITSSYSESNKTVYVQVSVIVENDKYSINLELGKNKLIPSIDFNTNVFS